MDYAVTGGTATQDTDYVMPGASAFVAALKRDAGLTAGGALSSQFTSLTAANVAISSVKDAQMYNAGNGRYYNYGASTSATSGTYMILGYDLSAYAGATVNRAELRHPYIRQQHPVLGRRQEPRLGGRQQDWHVPGQQSGGPRRLPRPSGRHIYRRQRHRRLGQQWQHVHGHDR